MRFYILSFYTFLVYISYLQQISVQTNHISSAQKPHLATGTVLGSAASERYSETLVRGLLPLREDVLSALLNLPAWWLRSVEKWGTTVVQRKWAYLSLMSHYCLYFELNTPKAWIMMKMVGFGSWDIAGNLPECRILGSLFGRKWVFKEG